MKLKVMFCKFSKLLLQMMHVISWNWAKNNDVINVTLGKTKTYKHLINDSMKFYMRIFQTKWQKPPLVQIIFPTKINSLKSCLDLVTLPQWQLKVANPQAQGIENLHLSKGIKYLLR